MIDTHCHLNFPDVYAQFDAVVERARAAGVDRFIVPGTDLESSTSSLELSQKYPFIFAGVGVHPTDAHEIPEGDVQKIKHLLEANKSIVSIGEVGLDYYHFEGCAEAEIAQRKQAQQQLFSTMIVWAREYHLPLILHTRDCFKDAFRMMKEEAAGQAAVIHCFTGTTEEALQWVELGCHISFTAIITYKKSDALREAVAAVPLDKIMLETDTPFLPAEGFRGQLGEPRFVREVAACVAEVKGISLEEVAEATTKTAEHFFALPHA